MRFTLRPTSNQISPDLVRKIKAVRNAQPAMQAAGLAIESLAKRAFREPGLRPAPWSPLDARTIKQKTRKKKSLAVLVRDAVLVRSPRISSVTSRSVTVSTDRPYAKYHQNGEGRMYRPFFPIDKNGYLTRLGRDRVEAALRKGLRLTS